MADGPKETPGNRAKATEIDEWRKSGKTLESVQSIITRRFPKELDPSKLSETQKLWKRLASEGLGKTLVDFISHMENLDASECQDVAALLRHARLNWDSSMRFYIQNLVSEFEAAAKAKAGSTDSV